MTVFATKTPVPAKGAKPAHDYVVADISLADGAARKSRLPSMRCRA